MAQFPETLTPYYPFWQELDQCYEGDSKNPKDAAWFHKRGGNDHVYMFPARLNRILDEVRRRILGKKPLSFLRGLLRSQTRGFQEDNYVVPSIVLHNFGKEGSTLVTKGSGHGETTMINRGIQGRH